MSASGLDLIPVLTGEHVRVVHPCLPKRPRAYMWCKTRAKKKCRKREVGGAGEGDSEYCSLRETANSCNRGAKP